MPKYRLSLYFPIYGQNAMHIFPFMGVPDSVHTQENMDLRKFVFRHISRSDTHQKRKKQEIVMTTLILMNPNPPLLTILIK